MSVELKRFSNTAALRHTKLDHELLDASGKDTGMTIGNAWIPSAAEAAGVVATAAGSWAFKSLFFPGSFEFGVAATSTGVATRKALATDCCEE
jgi:hypothetical protein